ncbi:MAG: XisI protein [Caldilineaceae bacterium]
MDRYAQSDIETELSFDDEHGNYLLLSVGWTKTGRMLTPTIYIRLHNGKIWVENDWTEAGIVDQLLERGVLQEDLVLAFQPPELRVYTEFAPA